LTYESDECDEEAVDVGDKKISSLYLLRRKAASIVYTRANEHKTMPNQVFFGCPSFDSISVLDYIAMLR